MPSATSLNRFERDGLEHLSRDDARFGGSRCQDVDEQIDGHRPFDLTEEPRDRHELVRERVVIARGERLRRSLREHLHDLRVGRAEEVVVEIARLLSASKRAWRRSSTVVIGPRN